MILSPDTSPRSIIGTSNGHACCTTCAAGRNDVMAFPYAPLLTVLAVAITPIRPVREASTAATAPHSIMPTMGTSKSPCIAGKAKAELVLHATAMASTPWSSRKAMISRANRTI